ncbi:hypothetical protein CL653_01385 [bacterium]|nr:hypothetical protein [bacterium]
MVSSRIVEYVFFFGLMGAVAFIVWQMFAPFVGALALSAIIVTICYPVYEAIVLRMPSQNRTLGALLTTLLVLVLVVCPLFFLASTLVSETLSIYNLSNSSSLGFSDRLASLQVAVNQLFPTIEVDVDGYLRQATAWLTGNLGVIFAGTASTVFLFFISIIGVFYLFRDGKTFTKKLIIISPLPDTEDELILNRLGVAVRSVATGTVLVALIQGTLTAFGLWLFGFERFVLWGFIAAFGALIPSVGTSVVLVPSILFLVFTGQYAFAIGLTVWGMTAVGLIDNLLGPYLISRGNKIHPFLILLSVLGGISVFGPIGFIVGPVVVSLFMVLLELYSLHISDRKNEISFTSADKESDEYVSL